jgi:hypothetical protein
MSGFEAATEVSRQTTGAIRSTDLNSERWDLVSWSAVETLVQGINRFQNWQMTIMQMVGCSIRLTGDFLGGGFKHGDQPELLGDAWAYLAIAVQKHDHNDPHHDYNAWNDDLCKKIANGAGIQQYELAPYHAIKRTASTCYEGGIKYGESNWLMGFPVPLLCNHLLSHLVKWCNGDRQEDHFGHGLWGFMAAAHMFKHRPDMCENMLGPKYTVTEQQKEILARHKAHRDSIVPATMNATFNREHR